MECRILDFGLKAEGFRITTEQAPQYPPSPDLSGSGLGGSQVVAMS